jgi:hypothetical protein
MLCRHPARLPETRNASNARRGVLAALGAALLIAVAAVAQPPQKKVASRKAAPPRAVASTAGAAAFFDKEVRPVLQASCWSCHSGHEPSGGLDLTSRTALLKGGASGPSVDLKTPAASLLLKAVHFDGRQMPPQGKLSPVKIAALERWVTLGLPWSAAAAAPKTAGGVAPPPVHHGPPPVNAETMAWWAFRPVKRPAVPKVKNAAWVRSPIDAFVLARLEANGFTPAPPASRAALIRRAYFDLWGLPPTPEDVRAFVADKSPDAWERVVDKLLQSPHYGERWGRHWLDLVRYAETNSFERDGDKPFVWRYRDYVIRSFNEDKPYDRFIREQLAGDEMPGATTDSLIATGYYRLGQWDDEPSDPEQARYDELDDIVSTTSQTFLGLTVGCARCHDHKIDPIPQKDYYRFQAFFQNVSRYGLRGHESVVERSLRPISPKDEQERYARENAAYKATLTDLGKQITAIEDVVKPDLGGGEVDDFKYEQNRLPLVKKRAGKLLTAAQVDEYVRLTGERDRLRKAPPKGLEMALCVTEAGPKVTEATHVLLRGSAHAPGDRVEPGFLSVLAPPAPRYTALGADARSSGRRLALADWIADPKNPLTARVLANRVFQYHFGRGIVRTTSNFGFLGSAPTHPELLDYLATEVVRNQWRLKPLHRQIMLSSAYRMGSRPDPRIAAKAYTKDPENDLLWRVDMRRLEAEEIRDALLAVNGSLNRKLFGPSILVTLPREVLAGQSVPGAGWGESSPEEQARRSVYIKVKRSLSVPILASYDAADTDATCPVRFATTQPTQALGMLNSAFLQQQARVFARFARNSVGDDPARQVRFVLWRALQREPTAAEVKRGVDLMASLRREDNKTAEDALTAFCLVTLNLNEFVYLD